MRKFLKKFFLIVLIVLLVIQIPFIYRRHQNGKLAEKIVCGPPTRADTLSWYLAAASELASASNDTSSAVTGPILPIPQR